MKKNQKWYDDLLKVVIVIGVAVVLGTVLAPFVADLIEPVATTATTSLMI